jgi:predicted transcriptional regulator
MDDWKLGAVETRFAELIWANAPLSSGSLVKLCEKELNWKKPTTYTVLRKLCEKGLFVNDGGTVRSLITREDFNSSRSVSFVNDTFEGSLPAFVAAFISGRGLSGEEADAIARMIGEYRKGEAK